MRTNDKDLEKLKNENRALMQSLAEMGERLQASVKLLSAISRLTVIPAKFSDLTLAAEEMTAILARELDDIDGCSILIYDPADDRLGLLAACGQEDLVGGESSLRNRDLSFEPGEGVAGTVFITGEPVFWDRDSEHADLIKLDARLHTPVSLACLPLESLERKIGVLNLSFGQTRPFDHPRQRELVILGGVAANLIKTFFLKAEVEDQAAALEEKVRQCELEIAKRAQTEETLRESENRYRTLFNTITELIYTHDLDGNILSANPIPAERLGYTLDEVIGRNLADFLPERHRENFFDDFLPRIKRDGQAEGLFVARSKGGDEHYIEFRAVLVEPEGEAPYVSGFGWDVTGRVMAEREMRRMEDQLAQSQKMEALGILSSGIAHDFNNILQAISGNTQLILNDGGLSEANKKRINSIDQTVNKAADVVKRLLTFSRKAETRLEPVDLNDEIRHTVEMLEHTIPKMISIETRLAEELKSINGDPSQLEQVLRNLGTNARDAMPDGGRLVFETRNVTLDEKFCQNQPNLTPGEYVLLKVSDTGSGMDSKTASHIFEPFFTTKSLKGGTGLGLYTVYGIVRSHAGHITCHSRPGQGTTFNIYLPVMTIERAPVVEAAESEVELPSGSETILMVDDEVEILETGQEFLANYGYRVLTADTGERALEIFREQSEQIGLVILDLGMPGMGGERCLAELLELDPAAKIIVASGYSATDKVQKVMDQGAIGFIRKPYRFANMLKSIRSVLDD